MTIKALCLRFLFLKFALSLSGVPFLERRKKMSRYLLIDFETREVAEITDIDLREKDDEVVRCKDCKYRDNDYCKEHHDHIDREEFCSRGEAK